MIGSSAVTQPLISVVMLTMPGRAKLRRQSLACLLDKTAGQLRAPPFELVIAMDDGDHLTMDEAALIVDSGVRRQVIYGTWPTVTDKHNAAIEATSGTWVTLWDDDDWSGPSRLAAVGADIADNPTDGIVGPKRILYHELIGPARRTYEYTSPAFVVDGVATFKRSIWEAQPFVVKSYHGDVGDWIARRVTDGCHYSHVHFPYVAMIHGKNATTPNPLRCATALDGTLTSVLDGPMDYEYVGDRDRAREVMSEATLQAYEAAVAP